MEREEYKLSRLRESVKKEVSMLVGWVGKQESSQQHLQQSLLESEEPRTVARAIRRQRALSTLFATCWQPCSGALTPAP